METMTIKPMRFFLCVLMLGLCVFLVCCTNPRLEWAMRDNPIGIPYAPDNVYGVAELPSSLQRVLFVPLKGEHIPKQEFVRLQEIFISELRRSERFSVVVADPNMQLTEPVKDGSLDVNKVSLLAGEYDVQAILELELTHYRAYKPMRLGVNARLFTLDPEKPEVMWAIDSLFDAGHDSVALGARLHAKKYNQQVFPLSSSYSSLNVPSRFAAYVAFTTFSTLPEI